MIRSDQFNEVAAALSRAQANFQPIVKDRVAVINSQKGSYKYLYADLSSVLHAVRPALAAEGLALVQTTAVNEKGGYRLDTFVMHESGQFLGSTVLLDRWPDPKQLGIEMTYQRRYQACALLGVASEEDTDSDGLDDRKPPARAKAAPPKEPPTRMGLAPEILSAQVHLIEQATTASALRDAYTAAYRLADAAKDPAAVQKVMETYRTHKLYVTPESKQRALT